MRKSSKIIVVVILTLLFNFSMFSDVVMTLHPFKDIQWTDSLTEVIAKVRKNSGKAEFMQIYLNGEKMAWDLKKLKSEKDLKLALLKGIYDKIQAKDSNYDLVNLEGKDGNPVLALKNRGVSIKLSPYKFQGVKAEVTLTFLYHPGIAKINPEKMLLIVEKENTKAYLPVYLYEIQVIAATTKFLPKLQKFMKKKCKALLEYNQQYVEKKKAENAKYIDSRPDFNSKLFSKGVLYDSKGSSMDFLVTGAITGGNFRYTNWAYWNKLNDATK